MSITVFRTPRPVHTVIFFGSGRFRRMRYDLRDTDPAIELTFERDAAWLDLGGDTPFTLQQGRPRCTLKQNGIQIAQTNHVERIAGRRRPELAIYVMHDLPLDQLRTLVRDR